MSNIISLVISVIVVVIVPKVFGVEEYGYWQLYLFYSSYVGFLHFGWSDGIYLRYGGIDYKSINKKIFTSQFYIMVALQTVISSFIMLFAILYVSDVEKMYILNMVAVSSIISNVLSFLILTLQATNRIKFFAQISITSRVSYVLLLIFFLMIGIKDYKIMILADLIGKALALLLAMYMCRDIVFNKVVIIKNTFREIEKNIEVGIKLMFANIASLLIIGIVRFGIEHSWSISTFGKVSLALVVSNFLMIFINSIGVVIFPILRNVKFEKLADIFIVINDILGIFLLLVLALYFPLNIIFVNWLPSYVDSMTFMALLFPIILYEGKMGLIVNTFLKTLRKEKNILRINLMVLFLSAVVTLLTTIIYMNLTIAVLSILVLVSFRCIISEFYLAKIIKVKITKDLIYESSLTITFILISYYMNNTVGLCLYLLLLSFYILLKKRELKSSFSKIYWYLKHR